VSATVVNSSVVVAERRTRNLRSFQTARRLFKIRVAQVGLFLIALALVTAIGAPLLAPGGYSQQNLALKNKAPFWMEDGTLEHPLGTDPLGRDVLARIIWSARTSLSVAGVSVLLAMSVGVSLGLISAYRGGLLDAAVMRLAEAQLAFPYLLLAIAVMALLQANLVNLLIILALRGWVIYARTVRNLTLVLKEQEYVQAAIGLGASSTRVIFLHLVPNFLATVVVITSFQFSAMIIAESSLSFLGLGVQPPTPSWGSMLSQGREYLTTAWWLGAFPGVAIMLTVMGMNLLGDGLRDALDTRLTV
jgi:peptide/nickel transport system permease protein